MLLSFMRYVTPTGLGYTGKLGKSYLVEVTQRIDSEATVEATSQNCSEKQSILRLYMGPSIYD